jgi:hypothetical protein
MFHLQSHLDSLYEAKDYRFKLLAHDANELETWQGAFREALRQILGIAGRSIPAMPNVEQLASVDRGSYSEEKYALSLDDIFVPFYLLIPKTAPPHKLIMAFHGHAPSVQHILGHYPDEESRQMFISQDENFAQLFAQDNFMVCAIEQRGFGERVTNQISNKKHQSSCRHLAFEYLMHGKTLLGERIRDAMAVLNYLQSRSDILQEDIGCTGHSGGATTAVFLAALDKRIHKAVISGYFCAFKQSILAMQHCECNYLPNLLTLSEIGEIAALIAPRRLGIVHGREDPIFPIAGLAEPYAILQKAYALANRPNALSLHIHEAGHRYDYAASRDCFD